MKKVFADTHYWVAVANPRDSYAEEAKAARKAQGTILLVTTDEVLVEFLNYFSAHGERFRAIASQIVRAIKKDPNVLVLAQTRLSFESGHELYDRRKDKQYSLTDCISMEHMRAQQITEVLTNDDHFQQEKFVVLIKSKG